MSQAEGLAGFLGAVDQPSAGLDLTLGRSSILLGAAILLDALPKNGFIDPSPLNSLGDAFWLNYGKRSTPSQKLRLPGSSIRVSHMAGQGFFTPLSSGAMFQKQHSRKASSVVSSSWRPWPSQSAAGWIGLGLSAIQENPSLCPAGAMAHAAMSFSGLWLIGCWVIRATSNLPTGRLGAVGMHPNRS